MEVVISMEETIIKYQSQNVKSQNVKSQKLKCQKSKVQMSKVKYKNPRKPMLAIGNGVQQKFLSRCQLSATGWHVFGFYHF